MSSKDQSEFYLCGDAQKWLGNHQFKLLWRRLATEQFKYHSRFLLIQMFYGFSRPDVFPQKDETYFVISIQMYASAPWENHFS